MANINPSCLEIIPDALKECPTWVLCKFEMRYGKSTKIPYSPSGTKAKADDRSTWSTFERCVSNLDNGYSSVGFEFTTEAGFCGIDFDKCVDPATGKIDPEVAECVRRLNSYTEYSCSKTGLHVIVYGRIPGNRNRKGNVEMYDSGRVFVVTGDHVPNTPLTIEHRQDELNALYGDVFGNELAPSPATDNVSLFDDAEVLEKARNASNGSKFTRLFDDGDTRGYPSASEAEMALCAYLVYWTNGDTDQADRLFRGSALMRQKWDERRGPQTYGQITIKNACKLVYPGSAKVAAKYANTSPHAQHIALQTADDKIYTRALELLQHGEPVKFYLEAFKLLHVGDLAIAEGILLGTAVQSVENALGIQSKLTGATGKGKSHTARSAMHLHPEHYVHEVSLSDKAIWYDQEIKTGHTIFSDDVTISGELEAQIKRATSNWQRATKRNVVQKISGTNVVAKQTMPARINWLLTSVNSQGSDELINRQMGYDVDEEQDAAYIAFELKRACDADLEFPITEDVLVCREFIRIMKENEDGTPRLIKVKIPFWERIYGRIQKTGETCLFSWI